MEYSGTWKEIWTQKGMMDGTSKDIRIYDGWEKSTSDMSEIAQKVKEILNVTANDRVLEIGCGAGGLAQFFDCEYIGIDFSKPLTEKCMNFFQKSAIYAEANDIPFRDKYFDKCFSWGVFLYFPDKEYMVKAVNEMKRVTKGDIFIGELPKETHDKKHLVYEEKDFVQLGFETMRGWADPYKDSRFNAMLRG